MQNWNLSYESAKFRQLSFLSSLHLFIKSLSEKSDMKLWFGEGGNEVLLQSMRMGRVKHVVVTSYGFT